MKAVALLSGGLDSTVAFAIRARDTKLALTIDYGQRAAKREISAAKAIAKRYRVRHRIETMRGLGMSMNALGDRTAHLPSPDLDDPKATKESARKVWVPNRNGLLIHMAAALAEAHGFGEVIVGFNKEEAATFPDNSAGYMRAVTAALHFSTANHVQVTSPTVRWNKRRIVEEGHRIGAPLHLIWPCYEGGRTWCLRCESCLRSLRAGVRS